MRVTIKDVARQACVSVGTASMAVNGKAGVNAATRARVMETAARLDYLPDQNARSLIQKKSSTLGLIVTDITNPFFALIIDGVRREAELAGYKLLLGVSDDLIDEERRYVDEFIARRVEGLLIVPSAVKNPDLSHLRRLEKLGLPFVFLTTAYPGIAANCIMTDLAAGVCELVKHLLNCGHRSICFLTGYPELLLTKSRTAGYIRAYQECRLAWQPEWLVGTYPDFQHGYDATSEILQGKRPDAIITVNDIMAMGVMKSLKDHGLAVPQDISVAGFDDLLFSSILETPLTTVRQPLDEICRRSVGVLADMIHSQPGTSALFLPALQVRSSTRNRPAGQIQPEAGL